MSINSENIRWASADEIDPITGLANKQNPPPELKTSGVKNYQPIARQWINNQFNELYNACVELQSQVDAIVGGSSQPTLEAIYPVDSCYISFSSTDPATYLGFGTWTKVEGSFLVSHESGDPDFGTIGGVGGAKTHSHTDNFTVDGHALTEAEMPAHTHDINVIRGNNNGGSFIEDADSSGTAQSNSTASTGGGDPHTHGLSGGVQSASNLPPYVVVNVFRRTA